MSESRGSRAGPARVSRHLVGRAGGAVLSQTRFQQPSLLFIAFEGHPSYFKTALNEILFLGAALARPLYPKHPQNPDADVTPTPEQGTWGNYGLGLTSRGQDSPLTLTDLRMTKKLNIPLKTTMRSTLKCQRYTISF